MRISDLKMFLSGGPYFIDPIEAEQYKPLVDSILNGNQVLSEHLDLKTPEALVYMQNGGSYSFTKENSTDGKGILVMHMHDVIMWNDGPCGMMGTESMANLLYDAYADESIAGIVISSDSPGGAAYAIEVMTEAIDARNKPVLTWVKHRCASAAYWISSHTDGIYAHYSMSRIGSIGCMMTYEPSKGEAKTYYAPQSKRKNNLSRQLEAGNDKEILEFLSDACDEFISAVNKNRGIDTKHEVFEGDSYNTEKALSFGLVDGRLTLAATIEKCFAMAETFEPKKKEMFGTKYKALDTLVKTSAEDRTEEMVANANTELQEAGLDAVLVGSEDHNAAVKAVTDLSAANKKATDLTAELSTVKLANKAFEDSNTALNAVAKEVFGEEAVAAEGFDLGDSLKALKAEKEALAKVVPGGNTPKGEDGDPDGGADPVALRSAGEEEFLADAGIEIE